MNDENVYKVATKYMYIDSVPTVKPSQVFKKSSTVGYEAISGIEMTLEELGELCFAVDNMFYDISNQWEDGMNIEDFVKDVRNVIYK